MTTKELNKVLGEDGGYIEGIKIERMRRVRGRFQALSVFRGSWVTLDDRWTLKDGNGRVLAQKAW